MSDRILSNRYSLESEIGRGGMGVVYKATDTQVKRTVAIKTLPAVMSHNQDLMRRFTSEVQHASKLEHPNIVRVYDVGEDEGTHFYVMQYIDGSDLRSQMKSKGRYSVDDAISIISQVADALDYAHSQGIVHRDIKPENILLDSEGVAHVADFGIAKATEGTRTTRGMLGTPEYMSPEQVKGKSVDGRSDQHSLAVVAYEMLTGRTPFKTEGDDPWAQINKHLNTPVPNPRTMVPDIPTQVANALLQALAKKPEQRFDSCGEFVGALKGEIRAIVPRSSASKPFLRTPKALAAGITLVVLLISATVFVKASSSGRKEATAKHSNGMSEQIVYVDFTNKDMPALCIMNPDGNNKRRLMWKPDRDYRTGHYLVGPRCEFLVSLKSGFRDSHDKIDLVKRIDLKTSAETVIVRGAEWEKRWGMNLDDVEEVDSNGRGLLVAASRKGSSAWTFDDSGYYFYDYSTGKALPVATSPTATSSCGAVNSGAPFSSSADPITHVMSADGRRCAFLYMKSGRLVVCNVDGTDRQDLPRVQIPHEDYPKVSLRFDETGSRLAVLTDDETGKVTVFYIDIDSNRVNSLTPCTTATGCYAEARLAGFVGRNLYIVTSDPGQTCSSVLYTVDTCSRVARRRSLSPGIVPASASCSGKWLLAQPISTSKGDVGTYDPEDALCLVDLHTGRVKMEHEFCRPVSWIYARQNIGTPIAKEGGSLDLPPGYRLCRSEAHIINGHKVSVQIASGKGVFVQISNEHKILYKHTLKKDEYLQSSLVGILVKDMTGDGVPEVSVCTGGYTGEPDTGCVDLYCIEIDGDNARCVAEISSIECDNSPGGAVWMRDSGAGQPVQFYVGFYGNGDHYFVWNGKRFVDRPKHTTFVGDDHNVRVSALTKAGFVYYDKLFQHK